MRKLAPCIKDHTTPLITKYPRTRNTSRGIIFNHEGRICLLHIEGDDIFGHRNHYEFPGGGIELGETPTEALHREIQEEIGYTIRDVVEVGTLAIEYHILKRIDVGHFFIAMCDKMVATKREPLEHALIREVCWIPWHEVEELLINPSVENIGQVIHRREYLAFQAAKSIWIERSPYATFTHQSR